MRQPVFGHVSADDGAFEFECCKEEGDENLGGEVFRGRGWARIGGEEAQGAGM